MNPTDKKLIFMDLDGTLIKTASGNKFPTYIGDYIIRTEVLAKLKEIFPNMSHILIVSNQGGIEAGFHTVGAIEAKFNAIQNSIIDFFKNEIPVLAKFCMVNNKADLFRKPNPGMFFTHLRDVFTMHLYEPRQEFDRANFDMNQCIMVGDASGLEGNHSDDDKMFALHVGIDYVDVEELLTWENAAID